MLATWIDKPESIYVWDAETGKSLHRFLQPDGAVYPKIAFTSDSKHFGGYHSVWDLKTGNEVLNLDGDFRAFSDDGPRVASLEFNKVQIWDLPNRKKLRNFPGEFRAFSKDGKRLTTLVDKNVVVWDVDSGKELQQLAGKLVNQHAGQIVAISDDNDLRLWDTATGKEMTRLPTVLDLEVRFPFPRNAFSDDGKKFAGLPMKELLEKATIWDTATGKPIGQLVAPRRRRFLGIALSPDGKTAATVNDAAGMMTSIYVWDAVSGKQLHGKVEGVRAVFSPDGKRIASADGIVIRTWDAATGKEKTPVPGPTGGVLCLSYSADGRSIVAGYDNVDASPFRTWDVTSRKIVRAFGPNPQRNLSGLTNKKAVFTPDGKWIFAVHWQTLLMLNASTGRRTELSDIRENSVRWLAVGPDGKNVAALEMRQVNKNDLALDRPKCEAVFRVLDGSTGKDLPQKDRPRWAAALQRLAPEPGPNTIAFSMSADFRLLAWIRLNSFDEGEPKELRLREIATGLDLPAVRLRSMVRALALSPDGRLLAVVTSDRRLVFWDVAAAKEVASWPNSQTIPKCVAFRPDGKSVAVGCTDSTILLYDVPAPPNPHPSRPTNSTSSGPISPVPTRQWPIGPSPGYARTRKRPSNYSRTACDRSRPKCRRRSPPWSPTSTAPFLRNARRRPRQLLNWARTRSRHCARHSRTIPARNTANDWKKHSRP